MHPDLENIGWTEERWNCILRTVTETAQKARVAAQILPLSGPESPDTVAVPNFSLESVAVGGTLSVDSDPTLFLTTIAVNVPLRTGEAADPDLKAALVMFRRAANCIARIEDALVFNGRPGRDMPPATGLKGMPPVFTVTGNGPVYGIFSPNPTGVHPVSHTIASSPGGSPGQAVVNAVVRAIDSLEDGAQYGPYACILGHELFEDICNPTANLVLPRDRLLPFLQGPLLRSSAVPTKSGALIALGGSPVELVVASDIDVRFVQTTLDPRFVFRVCERIAVRIQDASAIALLKKK